MLRHLSMRRRVRWAAVLSSIALVGLLMPPGVFAQQTLKQTTSLGFVPADVSFYASSLRNKEKFDAIVGSKAYASLQPLMQMGQAALDARFGGGDGEPSPLGMAKLMLELPENQKLLELLAEMGSEEMFVYGDQEYASFFRLYQQVSGVINGAQYGMLLSGRIGEDGPMAPFRKALVFLNANIDKLKVPTTVYGFRIKDADNATAQLKRLEVLLKGVAMAEPMLAKALKREKIGDTEFLVIRGDGSMVPWDEIPFEAIEETEGQFDAMVAALKKLRVAVSLGVYKNYVLLSIAPGTDHLASLGSGKLLIDRPEMAPVLKAAGKRLSSIGYVSDEFVQSASDPTQMFDSLINGALEGLRDNENLDGDLKKNIEIDLKALAADINSLIPKVAGITSYSFMTDRGFEGYSYNRSEDPYSDGSQKLTILDHVGGSPLAFVAGRAKYSTDGYDMLVKWAKRGVYYFDQVALDEDLGNLDDDDVDQYKAFKETFGPLLERAHLATRNKLLPSLKDGQTALVLDGKLKSIQWFRDMPPAKEPIALPEFGIVVGVSDVSLLKEAFAEYTAVIEKAIEEARELSEGEIPEFEFPKVQKREFSATSGKFEVYYYKLPAVVRDEIGLHKWLLPNAGLSSKFAAMSLAPLHTKRLLEDRPLTISGGPLAQRDRPLASAVYFNMAGVVDLIVPWIDYGFDQSQAQFADFEGPQFDAIAAQMALVRSQIHVVSNVLKCFRGYSNVTYKDASGQNVTHHEWHFQDLP